MSEPLTFWDHLDELRGGLLRSIGVVAVASAVAFCMKEALFDVVLAPASDGFFVYRWIGAEAPQISLINTGLTEQFMTHMRVAVCTGLLVALPYVLFEVLRFVMPGLYERERRAAVQIVASAYVMFAVGTVVNYVLVFPLTVNFLGTYQVSPDVRNMLTLSSYIDTLVNMSFVLGLLFELPVVCAILGRLGFIDGRLMRRYRRHAVVATLVVAAIVTPTTDVFTLMVVSVPIWLLYEASILIVGKTARNK